MCRVIVRIAGNTSTSASGFPTGSGWVVPTPETGGPGDRGNPFLRKTSEKRSNLQPMGSFTSPKN
jgi:hypothetical protein